MGQGGEFLFSVQMCIRDRSGEQQLALVRAYVKDNFVDKGMCADLSLIHI